MAADDDDYLSDSFLQKIGDHRPGVASMSAARRYRIEAEQREANMRQRKKPKLGELEKQNREAGLSAELNSTNKGFAMLAKMGYKPGSGLGKHTAGRTEPVAVEVKVDRKGLGHASDMERRRNEINAMRAEMAAKRARLDHGLVEDYTTRKRDEVLYKRIAADLMSCQSACFELDSQLGLDLPSVSWHWPLRCQPDCTKDCEDEEDATMDLGTKLEHLNSYLRQAHFYCVWCGAKFEDAADLANNCPGDTSEVHD